MSQQGQKMGEIGPFLVGKKSKIFQQWSHFAEKLIVYIVKLLKLGQAGYVVQK